MTNISVVMSVYNGEKFLRDAIASILRQTFNNFEFVIVNDGSTDTSLNIINSFLDKRIKVIDQSNLGLTKSLNIAIQAATGDFIARMDADDLSHPERLSYQYAYMTEHPEVGLLGTLNYGIDETGVELGFSVFPTEFADIRQSLLFEGNCLTHGTFMIRRQVLELVGGYSEEYPYSQDYELALRIAEKHEIQNLNRFLYYLRISKSSITAQKCAEQTSCALKARAFAQSKSLSNREFENLKTSKQKILNSHQMLSNLMLVYGANYLAVESEKLARVRFVDALKYNPFNLKAFVFLALTFFPVRYIKKIRQAIKFLKKRGWSGQGIIR